MVNGRKALADVGLWVPQIFFDVIARVIPGMVATCLFVVAACGPKESSAVLKMWLDKPANEYPSIILFMGGGLVVSYSVGIVLSGFRPACLLILKKGALRCMITFIKKCRSESENDEQSTLECTVWDMEAEFGLKYDFIKLKSNAVGNRITKLKAELTLADIFILSCCGSFVVNLLKLQWPPEWSRIILGIILLGTTFCSVGLWYHIYSRLHMAVENNVSLLGYKKDKTSTNSSSHERIKK